MTDTNPQPSAGPLTGSETPGPQAWTASGFSPERLHVMAGDLINAGRLTRDQANQALAADGAPPLPSPTPDKADPNLSPQAAEIDAAFPPVKDITEYTFPPLVKYSEDGGKSEPDAKAMAEFNTTARTWMQEARIPAEIGSSLAKTADVWNRMDDRVRAAWSTVELSRARNALGPKAEERMALARQLVDEIEEKRPGLKAYLNWSGAGNSSKVIVNLALHAERLAARRK